jgi:flagellar biosynthesis/type III secretory pathway chaperone
MSKMVKLLHFAQEQREMHSQDTYLAKESSMQPTDFRVEQIYKKTWLIIIVVFAVFLSLNLLFFAMTKDYSLRTNAALEKLKDMEAAVTKNSEQLNSVLAEAQQINESLEKMASRLQAMAAETKDLKQQSEIQAFAIENLIKAKNTLFNRLNTLEAEQK